MASEGLDRRLRIIESGYGREHGWHLEHRGVCLAVLTDPKWAEMFWLTYRIGPTTEDPRAIAMLRSKAFWASCDYEFRSRGFREEVVDHAFGARGPGNDEVTVRGLYLTIEEPTLWESVRAFRRLRRARSWSRSREATRPPEAR